MEPPILNLFVEFAMLASGAGAFAGGYAAVHPAVGGRVLGLGPMAGAEAARSAGGAVLVAHATALAALGQVPPVGACIAAGLGSAWLGAAAARAIHAVLSSERRRALLVRIGVEALVGLMLWTPLWTYLRLIREGRRFGGFG